MGAKDADIAILGGGLAGGLTALALAAVRPDIRVALIEARARLDCERLWSFFESDVDPADRWLVEPLIAARWPVHDVCFPKGARRLAMPYRTITSQRLEAALREVLPANAIMPCARVVAAERGQVRLADGRVLQVGAVIDARGGGAFPHLRGGWQVFYGRMVELAAPHAMTAPMVMDASVAQHNSLRFRYVLPMSPDTLFIEETYYSPSPAIDRAGWGARIDDWLAAGAMTPVAVLHEEQGCLPVVGDGDFAAYLAGLPQGIAQIGARAGLFHPLTSYSLPVAVRTALAIAHAPDLSGAALAAAMRAHGAAHWRDMGFYRMLAKMLFAAGQPDERYRMMAHFYTLPENVIARFYAGRMTLLDRFRLFAGRPPVSIAKALAALLRRGYPLADLGADLGVPPSGPGAGEMT